MSKDFIQNIFCRRNNCSICVEELKDECFWCENTQECFPFAHYISQHISGQCQEWVDSDDLEKKHTCRDCSIFKSCDDCLSRYGCGWCGNIDNRMIGKCVDGDFSGTVEYWTFIMQCFFFWFTHTCSIK